MKSKNLIIVIVMLMAILVLFPSIPSQITNLAGQNSLSTLTKNNPLSAITSVLSSNSAGEIPRGTVEVIDNRVIMHDGPTTMPQNIAALAIIGFFVIVGILLKGN